MTTIVLPDPALVLLIGPSGAGKSTFAAAHFSRTEVVSSDDLRAMVADDAADQSASRDAFALVGMLVNGRLKRGLTTVVDATNLHAPGRLGYRRAATRYGIPTIAIAFDLSLSSYRERNAARPDRLVADVVVDDQAARMSVELTRLPDEGYAAIHVIGDAVAATTLILERG